MLQSTRPDFRMDESTSIHPAGLTLGWTYSAQPGKAWAGDEWKYVWMNINVHELWMDGRMDVFCNSLPSSLPRVLVMDGSSRWMKHGWRRKKSYGWMYGWMCFFWTDRRVRLCWLIINMCSKIIIPKANRPRPCQLESVHFTFGSYIYSCPHGHLLTFYGSLWRHDECTFPYEVRGHS